MASETWDFFFEQAESIKVIRFKIIHGFTGIVHLWWLERVSPCAGPAATHSCSLSHFLVNRLSPRLGRPALPDALAAHLHPCAPPAPAGLLLVSWLCWPWARLSDWETRFLCSLSKPGVLATCVCMNETSQTRHGDQEQGLKGGFMKGRAVLSQGSKNLFLANMNFYRFHWVLPSLR